MSVRDMDLLIRTELSDDRSVENGYRAFLESLDGALSVPCKRWALMKELTIWRTPPSTLVC